jgi:uncharacterized membrane protein YedE/YeeE
VPALSLLAALLIGLAFGAIAARSHFCTMGALSDYFLFGSRRRLRGLAMAAGVSLLGTAVLGLAGWPAFSTDLPLPWLPVILGGFVFGIGMTLAGGCITRNLVRTGLGSFRAAATILLASLVAASIVTGLLTPSLHFLPDLDVQLALSAPWLVPLGLLAGIVLIAWCLLPAKERARAKADLLAGAGLGLLVVLWRLLVTPEPLPIAPALLLPLADLLRLLVAGSPFGAGVALVLGVILGAALTGHFTKVSRFETFVDRADLRRHLLGALLMGIGGGLAGTCSFGLIVSGIAALLPAAFLGTIALALGCRQTLRVLEGRSFFSR